MDNVRKHLQDLFRALPGIGTKQSERFVYAILEKGPLYASDISRTLQKLHSTVRQCQESFQYFETDDPTETLSPIVRDRTRDRSIIMVLEKDTDIEYIEKSHSYRGQYFVLGGLVPMLQSRTRETIRISELLAHVQRHGNELNEIILGLSFTPEGDHTRLYLETKLEPYIEQYHFTISALGRGLSVGSEIEYADPATITHALEHRIIVAK